MTLLYKTINVTIELEDDPSYKGVLHPIGADLINAQFTLNNIDYETDCKAWALQLETVIALRLGVDLLVPEVQTPVHSVMYDNAG